MASIKLIKNTAPGAKPWKAYVNVKGFDRTSKRFFSKAEAAAWATELETTLREEKKQKGVRKDLATLTVKNLITEYCADPDVKKLKTYGGLENLLAWWVNNFGSERLIEVGALKLREARELLLLKGREPATTNRYLAAMRACWNWGLDAGLIKDNQLWPSGRLFLTEPAGRKRFLSDDELVTLKEKALKHSPWMYAAVIVSVACGLRQGELLRLEWSHLDFEKQSMIIPITKTDQPRSVHLPAPAIAALKKLRRDGIIGRKHVFLNTEGEPADNFYLAFRWRKVRKAAGLVNFRWHDLRHSCASILAQSGASLPEIGSVLGHKSLTSTLRYSHLTPGKAVTGSDKLSEKLS